MKKKPFDYESMIVPLLEGDRSTSARLNEELAGFDSRAVRTLALLKLIEEKRIPFDLSLYEENFVRVEMGWGYNSQLHSALVDEPAKLYELNSQLGCNRKNQFERVLFATSMYLGEKLWPGVYFMGGALGKLYYEEGSFWNNKAKIDISPEDLVKFYFTLEHSGLNEIRELLPKIGQLYSDIDQVESELIKQFKTTK